MSILTLPQRLFAPPPSWRAAGNPAADSPWDIDQCWHHVLRDKLVEVSGGDQATARFSLAVFFVLGAQRAGETVAWVQWAGGSLYPPDLHDSGVDLQALAVIHVARQDTYGLLRAAEILLRSGGFGLVVLDATSGGNLPIQTAWQGRLLALTRAHHSSVVLLTHKPATADSLGPLVGLRLAPWRQIRPRQSELYPLSVTILKNKQGIDLPTDIGHRLGPAGLV